MGCLSCYSCWLPILLDTLQGKVESEQEEEDEEELESDGETEAKNVPELKVKKHDKTIRYNCKPTFEMLSLLYKY